MKRSSQLLLAGAALCLATSAVADPFRFQARLTGAQEVPEVDSEALAMATARFDRGFTRVAVRIHLRGDINVVAGHFHCARPGANGPIAFGILVPGPLSEITQDTRVTLTNAEFTGEDCTDATGRPVNNIAALALAMHDGLVYLNLHSPTAPLGQIRGQMIEMDD